MEATRPPAPGPGYGRPSLRAAGRDPTAAPVSVPAPPQGPASEFALPQEPKPRAADLGAPGAGAGTAGPPAPSAHIPVPAHRAPPGKARPDEVMAAAALTSLSTCPLLLGSPAVAFSTEPGLEPWKEALARPLGSSSSSSSSGGGDWGWDLASDQSSPSTPSPPLPPEAAHFLFGEPALRKRKSSLQVLFQCLWKRCGKVLSTASGMQRHIRLVHLGRQAEPEQSDGEEDFYYTELDVGVDSLTAGLSSLSPVSPSTCVPPAFPCLALPEPPALPRLLRPLALPPPPVLSASAPPRCATVTTPTRAAWHPPTWSHGRPQSGPARQPCPPSLVPPRGSPEGMPRSAGRCMAWSAGTSGAGPAAGRRPAGASWTEPAACPGPRPLADSSLGWGSPPLKVPLKKPAFCTKAKPHCCPLGLGSPGVAAPACWPRTCQGCDGPRFGATRGCPRCTLRGVREGHPRLTFEAGVAFVPRLRSSGVSRLG
uniref:C2H2-type domain-containing protein n=2 Tax=Sus scrofa TaxID=9823 RepID=A0A4X1T9X6_PIG